MINKAGALRTQLSSQHFPLCTGIPGNIQATSSMMPLAEYAWRFQKECIGGYPSTFPIWPWSVRCAPTLSSFSMCLPPYRLYLSRKGGVDNMLKGWNRYSFVVVLCFLKEAGYLNLFDFAKCHYPLHLQVKPLYLITIGTYRDCTINFWFKNICTDTFTLTVFLDPWCYCLFMLLLLILKCETEWHGSGQIRRFEY